MARVMITGAAGFIGSNLAWNLISAGHQVIGIDDLSLGRESNLPTEVTLLRGDVSESSTWKDAPAAEAVVHLAGASSAPMFAGHLPECFYNNIVGFTRVLDYARACGDVRVIYASTSSIYGNVPPPLREDGPTDLPNFYALSKLCMEQIAAMYHRQYHLDVVGLRFMSVYGPREDHKGRYANLVSQFIWDIEAGKRPVIYGDGQQTRDFTNVADIVQAIRRIIAFEGRLDAAVFNVGSGQEYSVNELMGLLRLLMDSTAEADHIPNPCKEGYVRQQLADLTCIRSTLGYVPEVDLQTGIREILALRDSELRRSEHAYVSA